ncbi:hypothetical protein L0F63_007246, partial [Massospora cicadina]
MTTGLKTYEYLLTETQGKVGLITLNRPKALNALCSPLMKELNEILENYDNDNNIAGADIKEMKDTNYISNYVNNFLGDWVQITKIRKPVLAAVNGYALGGGCELAMMCDIIYAGENAQFGQPEIKLGVLPGAGGRKGFAVQAEQAGLVSKVFPPDQLVQETVKTAGKIAEFSRPAVQMAKEAVNQGTFLFDRSLMQNAAFELSLDRGLHFERRLFQSTFGT